MKAACLAFLWIWCFLAGIASAEQITSTCRITAVDPANRTVTLVRKAASGERTGSARVAEAAEIQVEGKATPLASLAVPVEATVIYETESKALVAIRVASVENHREEDFVPLFDGKTLNGWQGGKGFYRVEDGNLIADFAAESRQTKDSGILYTEKEYGDFILRFEVRLTPHANNGILVRIPRPAIWDETTEIQVIDDSSAILAARYAKMPHVVRTGTIIAIKPADPGHLRPVGDWNSMEVTCTGRLIRVGLNGAIVVDLDLESITDPAMRNKPRVKRRSGYIAISGWDSCGRVEYRNIRIKDLSGRKPEPPFAVAPLAPTKARELQEAWAKHLGVPVETTNSIGMNMVLVPPGEFEMGSTQDEMNRLQEEARTKKFDASYSDRVRAESPRHRVRLTTPFYLGACEVTRGAFRRFVDDTGYKSEGEKDGKGGFAIDAQGVWAKKPEYVWTNPGFSQTDEHPVVEVSWADAAAFCQWLSRKEGRGYRLPTEAEWKYACRAGSTTRYSFGDDAKDLGDYAWYAGKTGTYPAGEKKPNAWGLYDMHGNVWEWGADWYSADYFAKSPAEDPPGPDSGTNRLLFGGSWRYDEPSRFFRCAARNNFNPNYRDDTVGFRVRRVASEPTANAN